jgi:hypothetical protein
VAAEEELAELLGMLPSLRNMDLSGGWHSEREEARRAFLVEELQKQLSAVIPCANCVAPALDAFPSLGHSAISVACASLRPN